MNRKACIAALAAVTFVALSACDQQASTGASATDASGQAQSGVHWEKTCAKKYFYRFEDGRQESGATYCGEWHNRCVDADGQPSAGCVQSGSANAS